MKKSHKLLIIFVLLLLVSLQFYDINKGFSHDDIRDINCANRSISSLVKATVVEKGIIPRDYPPVYFILLHSWLQVWGINEFALRMLSMMFGLISLFVFYKITKKLFDNSTALLSLILLLPYPIFIELNQSIRMYSLFFLLALLNFYLFISLLRRSKLIKKVFFIFVSSVMIYTHFYGIILIFIEFLFTLFFVKESKKIRKALLMSLLTILILSSPLILHITPALYETSNEVTRICLFGSLIYQLKFNLIEWLLFAVLLALSILGSLDLIKQGKKKVALLYISLSFFSLLFIISSSCLISFKIRHYTFLLPPLFMMTSHYILRQKKLMKIATLLIIICLYTISLNQYFTHTKDLNFIEWKSSSEYITSNLKDDDYILLTWYSYNPMQYYLSLYSKDQKINERIIQFRDKPIEEINLILRNTNRVWIVFHDETYECKICRTNNTEEILTYLNKKYSNPKIKHFKRDLNVLLYEK